MYKIYSDLPDFILSRYSLDCLKALLEQPIPWVPRRYSLKLTFTASFKTMEIVHGLHKSMRPQPIMCFLTSHLCYATASSYRTYFPGLNALMLWHVSTAWVCWLHILPAPLVKDCYLGTGEQTGTSSEQQFTFRIASLLKPLAAPQNQAHIRRSAAKVARKQAKDERRGHDICHLWKEFMLLTACHFSDVRFENPLHYHFTVFSALYSSNDPLV